jgi:hypothetical protein
MEVYNVKCPVCGEYTLIKLEFGPHELCCGHKIFLDNFSVNKIIEMVEFKPKFKTEVYAKSVSAHRYLQLFDQLNQHISKTLDLRAEVMNKAFILMDDP